MVQMDALWSLQSPFYDLTKLAGRVANNDDLIIQRSLFWVYNVYSGPSVRILGVHTVGPSLYTIICDSIRGLILRLVVFTVLNNG